MKRCRFGNKEKFITEDDAHAEIKKRGWYAFVFQCKSCGTFHITSRPPYDNADDSPLRQALRLALASEQTRVLGHAAEDITVHQYVWNNKCYTFKHNAADNRITISNVE